MAQSPAPVFLTDGGFGTHLQSYVGDEIDGELWSARFNVTRPDAVLATHKDFLMAGADLIRTNTYQASRPGYEKYLGMTREESEETFQRTIGLAFQAKQEFMKSGQGQVKGDIRVLASIGPYGAWLSDGSEYSGCYGDTVPVDVIRHFHKERLDVILRCGVDALAIETIPVLKEAEIIVDLLNEFHPKVPFWVSFSCKDENSLVHGEDFKEAVESIWDRVADKQNVLAIGVNCLDPKLVTPLLAKINNATRTDPIPLVAYPNSGEVFDKVQRKWITQEACSDFIQDIPKWVELGVKYVGGCCRNDAGRISKIRKFIDQHYDLDRKEI